MSRGSQYIRDRRVRLFIYVLVLNSDVVHRNGVEHEEEPCLRKRQRQWNAAKGRNEPRRDHEA